MLCLKNELGLVVAFNLRSPNLFMPVCTIALSNDILGHTGALDRDAYLMFTCESDALN